MALSSIVLTLMILSAVTARLKSAKLNMTASIILLVFCVSGLLTIAGCSKSEPKLATNPEDAKREMAEGKRISSLDVVRGVITPTQINAGGSGEIKVHLMVQPGYHINANPPTYPYLRATKLTVGSTWGGVSAGPVSYPKPLNRKFGFAEVPLDVYEGETDLKLNLTIDKTAAKGERSIPVMIEIQACDDEVCYAPAIMNLEIPLTIK